MMNKLRHSLSRMTCLAVIVFATQGEIGKNSAFALRHHYVAETYKLQKRSSFNKSSEEYFLKIMNELRQNVIPPASNMMLLEWSHPLAAEASSAARNCSGNLHLESNGFNIAIPRNASPEDYFFEVMDNISANYNRRNNTCEGGCGADEFLYIKTVWHGHTEVGCALEHCPDDNFPSVMTCLYKENPSINISDAVIPYNIGPNCKTCPGDIPACDSYYSLCSNAAPASLNISVQPGPTATKAGKSFERQPVVQVFDDRGELFTGMVLPGCPFVIIAEISKQSHHEAVLKGKVVVPVIDGLANFEDLAVSEYGDYKLSFTLGSEQFKMAVSIFVESEPIKISPSPVIFGECIVEEGNICFERSYVWPTDNCSKVCIEDCEGENSECYVIDDCGSNAICLDAECQCQNIRDLGFSGLSSNSLKALLMPEVVCAADRIALTIDKCGLNAIGFKLGDIYLLGTGKDISFPIDYLGNIDEQLHPYLQSCAYNDCRGYVTAGNDGIRYELGVSANFEDCNALIVDNETHITYHHKMRGYGGFSSEVVSRKRGISVKFSCTYPKHLNTSLNFGILPFLSTTVINVDGLGEFTSHMGIWKDETYTERYESSPTIRVPESIYVGITLDGTSSSSLELYADHCYATSTENPNDKVKVDLIVHGCAQNGSETNVMFIKHGQSGEVFFSINSFILDQPATSSLFIHCSMVVCVPGSTGCALTCSDRKKRFTLNEERSEKSITIGPVFTTRRSERARDQSGRNSPYFASQLKTLYSPVDRRSDGIPDIDVYFS